MVAESLRFIDCRTGDETMSQAAPTVDNAEAAPPVAKPAAPQVRPEKHEKPEVPPPWRVLLHNDEVNVFEHVVQMLHRITPLSMEEAFERTQQAHTQGRAILLSTHKERAELYVEQLTSVGLTVTMHEEN
jgi:ATP-dependent Clp protease adaptor protein ClpS